MKDKDTGQKPVLVAQKYWHKFQKKGILGSCKRAVNKAYERLIGQEDYMAWRRRMAPSKRFLDGQRRQQPALAPAVYILLPYQPTAHFPACIRSVEASTYKNWQLWVAATTSEWEQAKRQLADACGNSMHHVLVDGRLNTQQRIGQLFNRMADQAEAEDWCMVLRPQDLLAPEALYECVKKLEQEPRLELLYTDEDVVSADGSTYQAPEFKPDFNLDLLRASNYLGHAVLYRVDLVRKLGGWNSSMGDVASYEYALRAVETEAAIGHLPKAVYHRRQETRIRKAGIEEQGAAALNAHYRRCGLPACAEPSGHPGVWRTSYHWRKLPLVSVNIPNKDHIEDLDTCVQSLLSKCTYPNFEIVIIENNSTQERTFAYYDKLKAQDSRVRILYWKEGFNYARITNFGVANSRGEYILLLNNDTEVIEPRIIEELLGYCMRPDVGICGAKLLYFDDTIQHAGVVIGIGGVCGEAFQGFPADSGGYMDRLRCAQDYSAVTAACLMVSKQVFEEVGGMDGRLGVSYNDIDFCLKVRESGRLVVYNPYAVMHHYESKSRGTENTSKKLSRYHREEDLFTNRWAGLIHRGDPCYNPNLTLRKLDFSLRRTELLRDNGCEM